ncbi:hypothetical protein GH157_00105 [archaeon]|nr:hypothetical protein [archaeon]
MWTVRSESGTLRAVLVQESIEQFWEKKFPFTGIESNTNLLARSPHADIDGGREQWRQLSKYLEAEGVNVFEVTSILEKALDSATLGERRRMVEHVWRDMPVAPKAEDLTVEHLLCGYPPRPYYDKGADRVVLPDFQRVGWPYPRDTSFTTQVGTVICNMKRYSRRFEPRVVKLAYEYDPILSEKVDVIYDANETQESLTEPPCIEGGDTHIVDEETIAVGLGQRSTHTGFMEAAKALFDRDPDEENDMEHLMTALMEQARGASNIVTLKPGKIVAFARNHVTNGELRAHGIEVKEWEDSYLDMLGGPHCSTSPLLRDPV